MDGVGIINLPEHVFETYLRDELRHELPVVDTERLASDAEQKLGVMKEIGVQILNKEFDFLEMRGLMR